MNEDQEVQIAKVRQLCQRIIDGDLDLIEGCRHLNDLRWDLDDDGADTRFDYFVEFERRCFEIPPKESRHRWSESSLAKTDALAESIKNRHGEEFLSECRRLIKSYDNAS